MESMPKIGKLAATPTFYQLGIFVLDGSGSMTEAIRGGGTKAAAVDTAMKDLLTVFKTSKKRSSFSFPVGTFDAGAVLAVSPTPADTIDEAADYNPLLGHGGGTFIYEGLKVAEQLANDYLMQNQLSSLPCSVIILLMTDGECHKPEETKRIAEQIQQGSNGNKITICTTFFSSIGQTVNKSAKDLLVSIATQRDSGFKEVYDAASLRDFFERSISTSLGGIIISSGTNFVDM